MAQVGARTSLDGNCSLDTNLRFMPQLHMRYANSPGLGYPAPTPMRVNIVACSRPIGHGPIGASIGFVLVPPLRSK